jgi:hypothetical protein
MYIVIIERVRKGGSGADWQVAREAGRVCAWRSPRQASSWAQMKFRRGYKVTDWMVASIGDATLRKVMPAEKSGPNRLTYRKPR